MRGGIETFFRARLAGLQLANGSVPYNADTVFVDEAPRDFFKNKQYGAIIAIMPSREKRDGQLIKKELDEENGEYKLTRRTHSVSMLVRVILRAEAKDELWGSGSYQGLADLFRKALAGYRGFIDSEGNWVTVEIDSAARPWNNKEQRNSQLAGPYAAHVRFRCDGGLYITETVPWIPEINITPNIM